MLTHRLLQLTLVGGEWVLYLLVVLSVISVAVMIERFLYLTAHSHTFERLFARLSPLLMAGKLGEVAQVVRGWQGSEAEVARAGVEGMAMGPGSATKLMEAALAAERQRLERRLAILGTLGSNAPFIGLLGTVLGIIKAFHDLAGNIRGGASVVMAGISEALVATAAGLFVAIPAVVAYNYFMRRVGRLMTRKRMLMNHFMAALESEGRVNGTQEPETKG